MLYGWMDPTVWKAYKQTHTKLEDLPPLADYDCTKNLVKQSFPVCFHTHCTQYFCC